MSVDPILKLSQGFHEPNYAVEKPTALACGPIIGHGQIWEPTDKGSILAGLAKNHPAQVPERYWDPEIWHDARSYAAAESNGRYDAHPCDGFHSSLFSEQDVMDYVAIKSPSKAKRYMEEFIRYVSSGTGVINDVLVGKLKVKVEVLKLGKPPRVIHEFDGGETIMAHSWALPLEAFIKTRLSWKGLATRDKWRPIAKAVEHFNGDCYVVCLDDVARDGNTISPDFCALQHVLENLGLNMSRDGYGERLWRAGIVLATVLGRVISPLRRLLSGASYTSAMNWCTSRFLWYRLRKWLGLHRLDIIVICEGDDNVAVIRGRAYRRLGLRDSLTPDWIHTAGLRCGKNLKVEAMGWFAENTCWPCVGGNAVFHDGGWKFSPSIDRALIKAGWAVNHDWASLKHISGRVTARAWALNDRFDGVPIFWQYARVTAAYAEALGCGPIFDSDETHKFEEEGWDGGLASEPDDHSRQCYAVAYGVDIGTQLLLESLLADCITDQDYTRDLTREFSDLLGRA